MDNNITESPRNNAEESPPEEHDNGQNPAFITDMADELDPEDDFDTQPLDENSTLPLPPLETTTLPIIRRPIKPATEQETSLLAICRSRKGAMRNYNQDSCFVFTSNNGGQETIPPFGLFMVADGMGGHMDGDVAGRVVSRTVTNHVLESIYLPLLAGQPLAEQRSIAEVMEDAAAQANAALRSPDPEKEMGTTLTAGLLFGRRLYMIHIGDSRAYLYTNDTLKLLTTDHSVVKALEEAGQITPEEAAIHPNRNLLYRALMGENLDVDVFSTRLPPEGKLIFCSDGLWGMISEEELAEILASSRSMSEMAEDLIEMAVATGGNDDITIVLVEFGL